jgi:hypothetical protein
MIPSPTIGDRKGMPRTLASLWPLLGRPVALHRGLVDLCGVKTALMLSQAIYWTRKGVAITETDGWFHKRMQDWQVEVGLKRRSQEHARRRLTAMGVMEERLHGVPARLEFRVNLPHLADRLSANNESEGAPSAHEVMALFGAPLAFHASLAALTDSVTAGLLLSSLLHLTRRRLLETEGNANDAPWITLTTARWMAITGLSRREFDHARRTLMASSLIAQQLCGIPPTLQLRVKITALTRQLSQQIPEKPVNKPNLYVLDNQECGNAAISGCGDAQPSLSKTYKLDCPERANQLGRNVHDSLAKSAKTLMNMTTDMTTSLLPPLTKVETVTHATTNCGGGQAAQLIYPPILTAPEKNAVSSLLMRVPQPQAQLILDELEGRLRQVGPTRIPNRVGYVRRLRDLHFAGGFAPEAALAVQAGRQQRAEDAQRRAFEAEERARQTVVFATPEAKECREKALAQVKAVLRMNAAEGSVL